MGVIWGLSTDAGSADNTVGLLVWLANRLFPWATPGQVAFAHGVLRKLGHLTEYAILATLWFRALYLERRLGSAPSAWTALAISVAWAGADELHQTFVPSRTASPLDVLLDAAGATLALITLTRREALPHFRLRGGGVPFESKLSIGDRGCRGGRRRRG
jgi:VanZ family protein